MLANAMTVASSPVSGAASRVYAQGEECRPVHLGWRLRKKEEARMKVKTKPGRRKDSGAVTRVESTRNQLLVLVESRVSLREMCAPRTEERRLRFTSLSPLNATQTGGTMDDRLEDGCCVHVSSENPGNVKLALDTNV